MHFDIEIYFFVLNNRILSNLCSPKTNLKVSSSNLNFMEATKSFYHRLTFHSLRIK